MLAADGFWGASIVVPSIFNLFNGWCVPVGTGWPLLERKGQVRVGVYQQAYRKIGQEVLPA